MGVYRVASLSAAICCLVVVAPLAGGRADVESDILATVRDAGVFETFLAAVRAADLEDALGADGPLTVFVPTEEAFAKLEDGALASLLEPRNKAKLSFLIKYHIVAGRLSAADVRDGGRVTTLLGQELPFTIHGESVSVGNARMVKTDVGADNGVIHVVDTILLPE